ncbi:MAG: methylenetetrahydrofolate reductase [NAD(P)H] [Alphaproteobacteria bacterium]|nr:methylenetetrahydrofolate reductase [NAD(P)H] [Alphaproteobacteria bacterium]MBV9542198.1 methylenetetrahydrofolate reductase [NAD(P)H] [Alphaproteobacteria bacterium]MBV9904012.1 methylenetetrahydrofolate reductase [NAD(P)H] [Alphaproteobacteria bacterium]
MSLKDLATDPRPLRVSFEFSPPKTDEAEEALWKAIKRLEPLQPAFVSVTYGAGGSTRERTHHTVKRIVDETTLKPAAHLTCVAHTKAEIGEIVQGYWDAGIRHIVALRGDMPDMQGAYRPHPEGYAYTPDLIEGIRKIAPFDISVSCYPETHPDSQSEQQDIDLLKRKVDAGAQRALGQFGFDNDLMARYRDKVAAAGINIPIVPGIIPTTGIKAITRMAQKSGATVPEWIGGLYNGLEDDLETRRMMAAAILADQVQELRARGFEQFHFYTLNQPNLTYAACRILGIEAKDIR